MIVHLRDMMGMGQHHTCNSSQHPFIFKSGITDINVPFWFFLDENDYTNTKLAPSTLTWLKYAGLVPKSFNGNGGSLSLNLL